MPAQTAAPSAATSYTTCASLIERLQVADPAGWERLLHLYQPLLWHWARHQGVRPQDFDDVCQDVFKVVVTRIGSFELGERCGSFRAWLRAITRNVCRERRQSIGVEGYAAGGSEAGILLGEIADPSADEADPADLVVGLIRQAMRLVQGEFSDAHWRVFERLTFDGIAPAEVAHELGLTAFNVRAIKSRVRRRLNEELGDIIDSVGVWRAG